LALALTIVGSAAVPASADPWVKVFLNGADLTILVQVQHIEALDALSGPDTLTKGVLEPFLCLERVLWLLR
jgi:hypothetical protein